MRRLLGAGLITATLFLAALAGHAQAPSTGDTKSPRPKAGDPKAAPQESTPKRLTLDKLKLPPGAILILCDELKDSLKLSPRMVLLTPAQFQEMAERLSQVEQQPKTERPGECRLNATADGDVLQVQADFAFETRKPLTTVALGCRGAQLTDAKIKLVGGEGEGKWPLLDPGPAGYTVLIKKPGEYLVTLRFRVPITFAAGAASDGARRQFELGLPGAAATLLTLELAQPVREIRWGKDLAQQARAPGGKQKRFEDVPLNHLTNLVLSWREPVTVPDAAPLLTARGQVTVKLVENQVVTTAELVLTDLRGKAKEWKLWLPSQVVDVKVAPPEGIVCTLSRQDSNNLRILHLSEPTVDPIKLTVTVQHLRSLTRFPIGPFAVVDAFSQVGTIELHAVPAALRGFRLQPILGSEVTPAAGGHGPDLRGFFRYSNLSVPLKMEPSKIGRIPVAGTAPLEIELKLARGRVDALVEHTLHVRPLDVLPQASRAGGLQLQATTTIKITPLPGDPVDFLDVQLPRLRPDILASLTRPYPFALPLARPYPLTIPDGIPWTALAFAVPDAEWQAEGAEVSFLDDFGKKDRRVRVKLLSTKEPTKVVLSATWALPAGTTGVRLDLSRPLVLKEGRTRVRLETDSRLELLLQDLGSEMPAPKRHLYTYETDVAGFAELSWRPYRPELPVTIETDIVFHERDAQVRQQYVFQFPEGQGKAGGIVTRLSVPPTVTASSLKLGRESQDFWALSHDPAKHVAFVRALTLGREPLVLEYNFALPVGREGDDGRKKGKGKKDADEEEARPFEVPLPWPDQATKARSKVRLWSDPGTLPSLPADLIAGVWRDRGTEVVPGRGLPTRVLLADGLRPQLLLRLDRSPSLLAVVVVDRALVQVKVEADGQELYVTHFRLSKVHAQGLDIRLPAPAAVHSLGVKVNGLKPDWQPREGKDGGRVVHVSLPLSMTNGPVDLEVAYQLPRHQPETEGLWQTVLHPPEILGNVFLGRVRWQVTMPDSWMPVTAGADVHPEQGWNWHGWLLAPEPTSDAGQLEEWVTEKPAPSTLLPSLVCSRTSLEPLRLLRMPRQVWLLTCSGALLIVGLGLYFAPLSHYGFWVTASLLGLGALAAGVLWPAVVPAVLYGCEPGALVLVLLLGVQWMLQQRYRRQVVFLPGFKRLKPGSSLVRTGRTREASTVDAPTAAVAQGSSQGKGN